MAAAAAAGVGWGAVDRSFKPNEGRKVVNSNTTSRGKKPRVIISRGTEGRREGGRRKEIAGWMDFVRQ